MGILDAFPPQLKFLIAVARQRFKTTYFQDIIDKEEDAEFLSAEQPMRSQRSGSMMIIDRPSISNYYSHYITLEAQKKESIKPWLTKKYKDLEHFIIIPSSKYFIYIYIYVDYTIFGHS